MGRYRQAPDGYECRYSHSCPYLGGMSTAWVYNRYMDGFNQNNKYWQMYYSFREENRKLSAENSRFEKENAELRVKLKMLHNKQFKSNKKKNRKGRENSEEKEKKNKKRGAKFGHPGWTRKKPDRIDRTVHVGFPDVCPHCGSENLRELKSVKEHLQEDIVLSPRTVVTKYVHSQCLCNKCAQEVIKTAPDEIANAPVGPVAKSVAVYLRYSMGLSYRKVQRLFKDLFCFDFVHASALGFDRAATRRGMPVYEDLLEKIKALQVAYGDETSWRENGINHHLWYAGNDSVGLFHIDRHRSSEVAKEIFGENFEEQFGQL